MKKLMLWILVAVASWYSTEACRYNPDSACPTASGRSLYELEKKQIDFAASYHYPLGAVLEVRARDSGRSVIVTVLDRGPAKRLHRAVDLSKSAFRKIADPKKGITEVEIKRVA